MDLANLNLTKHADCGAVMYVVHPITGEQLYANDESPVTITLLGADSTKMRQAMSERAKKRLAQNSVPIKNIDEAEKLSAELLANVTVSWNGITENGLDVECNFENVASIYGRYSWLRQQADTFVANRANFYKA